jgi:hypothetical protein
LHSISRPQAEQDHPTIAHGVFDVLVGIASSAKDSTAGSIWSISMPTKGLLALDRSLIQTISGRRNVHGR